jgi:sugar phosphate isomerase/epimerase
LPEDAGPERAKLLSRVRRVAEIFGSARIRLGLETGQETAEGLLHALHELGRPDVGVNFDPANMILYGMGDPIEALRRLAPHVVQVHLKDARPAARPGEWGEETPAGAGVVDWDRFFSILRERRPGVAVVVEREAGEDRVRDVRTAVELAVRVAGTEA